jgi:hypothetical protein
MLADNLDCNGWAESDFYGYEFGCGRIHDEACMTDDVAKSTAAIDRPLGVMCQRAALRWWRE